MTDNKKVLLINKESFLHWYFDQDIIEDFFHRHGVFQSLLKDGKFELTAEELLDGVGYLPEQVVEEGQDPILDDDEEVEMSEYDEIKFSNTKK